MPIEVAIATLLVSLPRYIREKKDKQTNGNYNEKRFHHYLLQELKMDLRFRFLLVIGALTEAFVIPFSFVLLEMID